MNAVDIISSKKKGKKGKKKPTIICIDLSLCIALSFLFFGCAAENATQVPVFVDVDNSGGCRSIHDIIVDVGANLFSSLLKEREINFDYGEFTVFAPTDILFAGANISTNINATVSDVLFFHIAANVVADNLTKDLPNSYCGTSLLMLNNMILNQESSTTICAGGEVYQMGPGNRVAPRVVGNATNACNGVVYTLNDSLMLPTLIENDAPTTKIQFDTSTTQTMIPTPTPNPTPGPTEPPQGNSDKNLVDAPREASGTGTSPTAIAATATTSPTTSFVVSPTQMPATDSSAQKQEGGEAGKLDTDVGVGVDINEDIEVLYNPNTDQNISYGYWCSDAAFGCSFRMFGNIGGELLMVDSGSSNLAFCNIPNTARVYNVKRLYNDEKLLAQCATFAGGNHGWFGSSYTGSIVELEDTDEDTPTANSVFSVMDRVVGLNGNSCGPIKDGSIGLEQSAVRGIWGIAGMIPGTEYNTFVYNDEIDLSTWPDKGDRMVEASTNGGTAQCKNEDNKDGDGCQCPVVATTLPTNFNSAFERRGADRYAITWDGTFGKNSGRILIGNEMNPNWKYGDKEQEPKIEMIRSERGVIKMNVLRMEVNGINIPINVTSYKIDTGSPKITLPREVYDAIKFDGGKNSPTVATITFLIPTLVEDSASNSDNATITTTKLELSATQELMNEPVFIPAPSGSTELVMGLNIMRYAVAIGFVFSPDPQPYLQFVPRTPQHILTPIKEIPVSENGVAGSFTNVTIDLDAYKTPDPSGGCSYTTTTTRITLLVVFVVGSVSTVLSFY